MAARPQTNPPDETEPPVGVDSAGVYEGLSAEDLGYVDLPRVENAGERLGPEWLRTIGRWLAARLQRRAAAGT